MKNQYLFLLFLFVIATKTTAQQLLPFVISSSGCFYSNSSGMLSFTAAEMSAVETYISPSAILTQGFQQAWDFGTYITEYPGQDFSFGIFPNPTGGHFNLLIETETNCSIEVKILDLLGKEMMQASFHHQGGINVESFDLGQAAQGIYVIALTVKENKSSLAFHFMKKIHIVK